MKVRRSAHVVWEDSLKRGSGVLNVETGVFDSLALSLRERTSDGATATNPEELLAAAYAACYAMSLRAVLDSDRTLAGKVDRIEASAETTLEIDGSDWSIICLYLKITLPRAVQSKSQALLGAASAKCPVSKAISSAVNVEIEATYV